MTKILMKTPLVEMDGDEMTRVLWSMIKDKLITPFIDLKTEYYDLGLMNRDATEDEVTMQAAQATLRLGVAVKCATITPNAQRMEEYKLKKLWKSPNATIRAVLDGTVFRTPVLVSNIKPAVKDWNAPITVARHAYGDVYKAVESWVPAGAEAHLVVKKNGETLQDQLVHRYEGPGIALAQHNTDESIASFARSCFTFALAQKQDLWFSTKDTISKTYDHRFKDVFQEIFDREYREAFAQAGIEYFYTLIDDAVSRVMRSKGGFIWALKNYDGDVMSDMIAASFGSLAMMTSALVSPQGGYEFEAAHGTVTRHYYRYLKGEATSTNPVATLFAWTMALAKRGELDGIPELTAFAGKIEKETLKLIESGVMTGDIAPFSEGVPLRKMTSEAFLDAIAERL